MVDWNQLGRYPVAYPYTGQGAGVFLIYHSDLSTSLFPFYRKPTSLMIQQYTSVTRGNFAGTVVSSNHNILTTFNKFFPCIGGVFI
jgi:hypothetical protein